MSIFQAILYIFKALCATQILVTVVLNEAQAAGVARSESRIVGGRNVTPFNKYPMMVAFLEKGEAVCGGTILNKYYILTTGTCAEAVNDNPPDYYVLAGAYQLENPDPELVQNVSCKSAIVHIRSGDPSKGFYANKIGVIRLSRPLIWNSYVAPTNLPVPGWTLLPNDQVQASVVGWGLGKNDTYPYPPTRPLQELDLPLLTTEACQRESNDLLITDYIICTAGGEDIGPCGGDNGTPLFIYNEAEDKHTQIGLNAWYDADCGSGYYKIPAGYTKISKFVHWIEEATRECNPPRNI